ncbi:MAG: response regulator [Polyangiales bacterium]
MQSILICDDDPEIRTAMKRTLRGYDVVEASTPREAMDLLKAHSFDALISDYNLGTDSDGLDLLQHTRVAHPDVVRFLVTGNREVDVAARAVNEGSVHRYFLKPWDDDKLRSALVMILRTRK